MKQTYKSSCKRRWEEKCGASCMRCLPGALLDSPCLTVLLSQTCLGPQFSRNDKQLLSTFSPRGFPHNKACCASGSASSLVLI